MIFLLLLFTPTSQASEIYAIVNGNLQKASVVSFSGAAAAELYASLSLPETDTRDEHGGPITGKAKFGKNVACTNTAGRFECQIK